MDCGTRKHLTQALYEISCRKRHLNNPLTRSPNAFSQRRCNERPPVRSAGRACACQAAGHAPPYESYCTYCFMKLPNSSRPFSVRMLSG